MPIRAELCLSERVVPGFGCRVEAQWSSAPKSTAALARILARPAIVALAGTASPIPIRTQFTCTYAFTLSANLLIMTITTNQHTTTSQVSMPGPLFAIPVSTKEHSLLSLSRVDFTFCHKQVRAPFAKPTTFKPHEAVYLFSFWSKMVGHPMAAYLLEWQPTPSGTRHGLARSERTSLVLVSLFIR